VNFTVNFYTRKLVTQRTHAHDTDSYNFGVINISVKRGAWR